jgi:N-acetylglucosamine malate deacetylase 1
MKLDVLIFAAHPDDAELSMGGTIAKLSNAGLHIGVIDLSGGELGSRGTIETRKVEAQNATEILKLAYRENLGFPDGRIKFNDEFLKAIISRIRKFQPEIIFAPYKNDRHPDHIGTSQLVKEAMFSSGLPKVITEYEFKGQEAYRPKKLFYYMQMYEDNPSFVVNISETFDSKMLAIRAYVTQFHNSEIEGPETFISQPNFLKFIEARARYFGFKIGKDYGEPFYCEEEIEFDLINFINKGL